VAYYRDLWDGVDATVKVSPDVMAGLMVSNGQLLVGEDARTPCAEDVFIAQLTA